MVRPSRGEANVTLYALLTRAGGKIKQYLLVITP